MQAPQHRIKQGLSIHQWEDQAVTFLNNGHAEYLHVDTLSSDIVILPRDGGKVPIDVVVRMQASAIHPTLRGRAAGNLETLWGITPPSQDRQVTRQWPPYPFG